MSPRLRTLDWGLGVNLRPKSNITKEAGVGIRIQMHCVWQQGKGAKSLDSVRAYGRERSTSLPANMHFTFNFQVNPSSMLLTMSH